MSNPTETKKKPAFIAYQVREREGQKAVFTQIGAAWPHKDGKGYNILLEVLPINRRITLLAPVEKPE